MTTNTDTKLFGIAMYDVPTNMRHLYGKIRKAMGPNSILQTWSCRMFPWSLKDKVENALEDINAELARSDRVRYRILLLDGSQKEEHEQMVFEALQRMLRGLHNNLRNRIRAADEAITEAEAAGSTAKLSMDKARNVACRKARADLKEARRLALLFDAEKSLDDAFRAYNKIIETEDALGAARPSADANVAQDPVAEELSDDTAQKRAEEEEVAYELKTAKSN